MSDPGPFKFPAPNVAPSKNRTPCGTVIFQFEASAADCVKLAADFTGWERQPLDLRRMEDGTWQIAVELPRGCYSYRFLVDNEWRDDPRCVDYEPNPYGGLNAVVKVL
jgi:1,4-alpha-glucan branching enzyme